MFLFGLLCPRSKLSASEMKIKFVSNSEFSVAVSESTSQQLNLLCAKTPNDLIFANINSVVPKIDDLTARSLSNCTLLVSK